MEYYPLRDFDIDQETDFLLDNPSHGNDNMEGQIRTNRNPSRRRSIGSVLCR